MYHGWELPVDQGIARDGLELFAEAMDLAETDEVKARVEKASICAYAAVLDPIWRLEEDAVIAPTLAARLRPLATEFFRLCEKYELGERSSRDRIEGILAKSP